MMLAPIRAALASSAKEADVLEANGVNVQPLRRFVEKMTAAVAAVESGTEYLSTVAYARRKGVSAEAVRQWCEAGKIKGAIRTGSRWKIPSKAAPLDTMVENRRGKEVGEIGELGLSFSRLSPPGRWHGGVRPSPLRIVYAAPILRLRGMESIR